MNWRLKLSALALALGAPATITATAGGLPLDGEELPALGSIGPAHDVQGPTADRDRTASVREDPTGSPGAAQDTSDPA